MNRLPLLVIGGYLGSGKTTLIRSLLRRNGGRRLLVLVNDFGAINIDAELIASSDGDTISLSNGCVCCSMSGDLYYAIGDALDRVPQPDLIIVEASGVSEPARIAAVAHAEPMLEYAGVVTLVDVEAIEALLCDDLIGAQVARQIAQADLIVLSKTDRGDPTGARRAVREHSQSPCVIGRYGEVDPEILLGLTPIKTPTLSDDDHAKTFEKWTGTFDVSVSNQEMHKFLSAVPDGVFRLKGWFTSTDGTTEVHRVGLRTDLERAKPRLGSSIVAITPAGTADLACLQVAWDRLQDTSQ